jgi:hypothetical protein
MTRYRFCRELFAFTMGGIVAYCWLRHDLVSMALAFCLYVAVNVLCGFYDPNPP